MKKIIPVTLTLLLMLFAGTALADQGYGRGNQGGYSSKGDRIEHQYDRKANHAADRGNYRQARHFQNKGERMHARIDHRRAYRYDYRHDYRRYAPVVVPVYDHRHNDNYFSVMIQQPGLLLGWGFYQ